VFPKSRSCGTCCWIGGQSVSQAVSLFLRVTRISLSSTPIEQLHLNLCINLFPLCIQRALLEVPPTYHAPMNSTPLLRSFLILS
jgi:hypothetical protein